MTHKNNYDSLHDLLEIMRRLRADDGCPWDAQQTPESLAPYILEEACELVDAIEEGSLASIQDELGDLLLQVVFQAQIFRERGLFDFHDVARGIADKLWRRHPHVFAAQDDMLPMSELDKQWERIKTAETTYNRSCLADHLPTHLPALQRAQKFITKTHKAGRHAELKALLKTPGENGPDSRPGLLDEDEAGELLFDIVSLCHASGIDAESALRKTTRKLLRDLDPD